MLMYIIKRLLFLIPMAFIVSFIAFFMINASTDNLATTVLEAQGIPRINQELIDITNKEYGFDKPLLVRYKTWLQKAVRFDFGKSFVSKSDVSETIKIAFLYTLQIALAVAVVTVIFSLILGVLCVVFEGRFVDRSIRLIMFFMSAIPSYLIGTISIWYFSVKLPIFPTSGAGTFSHYVLPTTAMALGYCGFYFRMIRNSMLENIHKNYVSFLKSSGVKERKILKHILKNSLQTVITAFSMAIPAMIAGTVVIENVFSWPGIGRLCVSAIFNRDIPIIQAYILLIAVFYCVFNVLSDIVNILVNPKLRRE